MTGKREFDRAVGLMETLGSRGAGARQVDVTLIGGRRMALLNRDYKGRRGAAEILTFVYDDDPSSHSEGAAGEILICWKKVAASAARLGVSRKAYLLRLVAHGLSHIEGFSHGDDGKAEKMERREREILDGIVSGRDLARMFGG
ncbi:MAG: rRNA maturation RNase YbeY [Candidatus Krumholzibacteria bacterium]|nr:rRNA maturation RNase YbeY [Candidatus Krumholzibacteria bacterium]